MKRPVGSYRIISVIIIYLSPYVTTFPQFPLIPAEDSSTRKFLPLSNDNTDETPGSSVASSHFEDGKGMEGQDVTEGSLLPDGNLKILDDWGGNCTLLDWDNCKAIKSWFGKYKNPNPDEEEKWLYSQLDCKIEPSLCMKNGWTVNRCHLLCMFICNKELLYKYDKYVSHEGEC